MKRFIMSFCLVFVMLWSCTNVFAAKETTIATGGVLNECTNQKINVIYDDNFREQDIVTFCDYEIPAHSVVYFSKMSSTSKIEINIDSVENISYGIVDSKNKATVYEDFVTDGSKRSVYLTDEEGDYYLYLKNETEDTIKVGVVAYSENGIKERDKLIGAVEMQYPILMSEGEI